MQKTEPGRHPADAIDLAPDDMMLEDTKAPRSSGRPQRRAHPATRVKLFVAGVMALLAVAYLVFSATQTSAVYYLTISEMEAMGPDAAKQPVRVGGLVIPGTIQRDGTTLRFRIVDAEPEDDPVVALKSTKTLDVVYQGVVPDIFQDQVHVVVEGKPGASGAFEAKTLLAKCPSRFETAPGGQPAAPESR